MIRRPLSTEIAETDVRRTDGQRLVCLAHGPRGGLPRCIPFVDRYLARVMDSWTTVAIARAVAARRAMNRSNLICFLSFCNRLSALKSQENHEIRVYLIFTIQRK